MAVEAKAILTCLDGDRKGLEDLLDDATRVMRDNENDRYSSVEETTEGE